MNRRQVVAWTLYDFANSSFAAVIAATIYATYYAQVVVGNARGEGDLWWGRLISTSMAIVALISPILGGVADRAGIRKRLFFVATYLSVTATALMATVEQGMVLRGFVLGVLGMVGFEGAMVFYNAYLPDIASRGPSVCEDRRPSLVLPVGSGALWALRPPVLHGSAKGSAQPDGGHGSGLRERCGHRANGQGRAIVP